MHRTYNQTYQNQLTSCAAGACDHHGPIGPPWSWSTWTACAKLDLVWMDQFCKVPGAHFAAHYIVCCVHIGEQCEADLSALLAALDRDANGLPA